MQNNLAITNRSILSCLCILIAFIICNIKANAQAPNTLGFIPASIEEIDVAFPMYKKWHLSGQMDMQLVTQGAYTNKNPFAYAQRFVLRPWIEYAGLKNMKLWLGYAHNQRYAIQEAGNTEYVEQRLIIMGTYAQNLPKGNTFEQLRFETKFFDDNNGVHRTIPRLRARVGVNHFLVQKSDHPWFKAPNITYYAELMLKFAPDDYSTEHFDIFRESIFYSAGLTQNVHFAIGILGQIQERSKGGQFDIYYGPLISFKYNITPKPRETFDNVDISAD